MFRFFVDTILAYWDYEGCGPYGDDFNWDWCGCSEGSCQIQVDTNQCPNGIAYLVSKLEDYELNGCKYYYYATYTCTGNNFEYIQ